MFVGDLFNQPHMYLSMSLSHVQTGADPDTEVLTGLVSDFDWTVAQLPLEGLPFSPPHQSLPD